MFILTDELNRVKAKHREQRRKVGGQPIMSVERRIAEMLAHGGSSITMTSVTDAIAFGTAALTELDAMRSFSIYAAFAVTCCYLLQITLYPALLALDERRQDSHRCDWLCCVRRRAKVAPVVVMPAMEAAGRAVEYK